MKKHIKSFLSGFVPTIVILMFFTGGLYYFAIHIPKQRAEEKATELYHYIFGDDERIFELCLNDNTKIGKTYTLDEITKTELICKCVVVGNKDIFIRAIKETIKNNGIDNFMSSIEKQKKFFKESGVLPLRMSITICSGQIEDYGIKYFEQKYGKIEYGVK